MTARRESRRVVLKGANVRPRMWWLWRAIWILGASTVYAGIVFFGWPLVEQRASDANAGASNPSMPALLQAGLCFGAFAVVAVLALALCWRRRGLARIAVLTWPLVMLASPEVARLLPGPWIWMVFLLLGFVGAVLIAGPDEASRQEFS